MSDRIGPAVICYESSDDARREVGYARALLRHRHAVVVRVASRRAGTPGAVLEEARNRRASVIVVASHGRSSRQPRMLGSTQGALVHLSMIPVLVMGPRRAPPRPDAPTFVCYDGSGPARQAVVVAAELLAARGAVVASLIPPVDDSVVLRSALPWALASGAQDRLARIDREEGEGPASLAIDGSRVASAAGLTARALAIRAMELSVGDEENPWRPLLRAAADEDAGCIVVGHRSSVTDLESTAYGLVAHADRPVLVVPSAPDGE